MNALLIATTALVSVGAAAAGPLPAREPPSSHYGMDANEKFLCDYGSFHVSFYAPSFTASGLVEDWVRAAVPVRGKGQTVSAIEVGDSFYSPTGGGLLGLTLGIYSSRNNKPFELLAGARKGAYRCPVTFSVGPVQLQQGKKYWIVERTEPISVSPSDITPFMWRYNWHYRTTKTHDAKWQSGSSVCSGSTFQRCHLQHSTAWEPMTGGTPNFKLITGAGKRDSRGAPTAGPRLNRKILHEPEMRLEGRAPPAARAGNRGPP